MADSYRRFWKRCKAAFPEVYAYPMGDWFRICKSKAPRDSMEIHELGSGRTRYEAWRDAARNLVRR